MGLPCVFSVVIDRQSVSVVIVREIRCGWRKINCTTPEPEVTKSWGHPPREGTFHLVELYRWQHDLDAGGLGHLRFRVRYQCFFRFWGHTGPETEVAKSPSTHGSGFAYKICAIWSHIASRLIDPLVLKNVAVPWYLGPHKNNTRSDPRPTSDSICWKLVYTSWTHEAARKRSVSRRTVQKHRHIKSHLAKPWGSWIYPFCVKWNWKLFYGTVISLPV